MLNGNNKIVDWGIPLDAYIYLGFHKKSFSNVLDRIMHRFSYEKSSKFHHLRITQFGRLYIWSLSFFFLLNTTWILVWKKKTQPLKLTTMSHWSNWSQVVYYRITSPAGIYLFKARMETPKQCVKSIQS